MLQTLKCNEQFNGRAAERRIPGNLFGNEAALLAKDIGAKLVNTVPFRDVRIKYRVSTIVCR